MLPHLAGQLLQLRVGDGLLLFQLGLHVFGGLVAGDDHPQQRQAAGDERHDNGFRHFSPPPSCPYSFVRALRRSRRYSSPLGRPSPINNISPASSTGAKPLCEGFGRWASLTGSLCGVHSLADAPRRRKQRFAAHAHASFLFYFTYSPADAANCKFVARSRATFSICIKKNCSPLRLHPLTACFPSRFDPKAKKLL